MCWGGGKDDDQKQAFGDFRMNYDVAGDWLLQYIRLQLLYSTTAYMYSFLYFVRRSLYAFSYYHQMPPWLQVQKNVPPTSTTFVRINKKRFNISNIMRTVVMFPDRTCSSGSYFFPNVRTNQYLIPGIRIDDRTAPPRRDAKQKVKMHGN